MNAASSKKGNVLATYIGDSPLMARGWTVRRGAGHGGLKGVPIRAARVDLACEALPAAQYEGLGPDKLDVDPEIAYLSAWGRVSQRRACAGRCGP
jgi:hypothetical protein